MDAGTTLAGDALLAASGKAGWVTPALDLVTAFASPPGKGTVIGDITVASFTGYTQVTPTLSAVYTRQPEGEAAFAMSQGVFLGPTSGAAQSCVGWVLTDGATGVYAYGVFDTPINMASTSDRAAVDAEFAIPPAVDSVVGR